MYKDHSNLYCNLGKSESSLYQLRVKPRVYVNDAIIMFVLYTISKIFAQGKRTVC